MQVYGVRMFNFFRFGEENNSVVFDVLDEDRKLLSDKEVTLDEIYDKLKVDPVSYIKKVKKQGVTNLMSIAGVIGDNYDKSNGTGKSTVLEAICYAHYNQIVRKNVNTDKIEKAGLSIVTKFNGKLPKNLQESYVEEIFEESGRIYRIKRGHKFSDSQKSHSPIVEFECINEDEIDRKSSHRTPSTSEAIDKVNDMSYDIFVNGVMFGQNDAGKFLTGTDKTRKEMLVALLHLEEVVSGCLENVRNRKNFKEKEINHIRAKLDITQERLRRGEPLEEIEKTIASHKKSVEECNKLIDEVSKKVEKLSESEVLKKIETIKEKRRRAESDLVSIKERKESQIKEWRNLYEKVDANIKSEQSKISDFTTRKQTREKQIKDKMEEASKFNLEEFNVKVSKVQKAKVVKPKYVEELNSFQSSKEASVKVNAGHETKLKDIKEEIALLQKQIDDAGDKDEFVCDKCKSKVSKGHIVSEIENNNKKKSVLEELSASCKKTIEEASKNLVDHQEKIDKINGWINQEAILESQKKSNEGSAIRIKELQEDISTIDKSIQDVNKECALLEEQKVKYRSRGDEIKTQYDSDISNLEGELEKIKIELAESQKDAGDVQKSIDVLNVQKSEHIQKKSDYNSNIGSCQNEIETIKKDQKTIEELNKEHDGEKAIFSRLLVLEDVFGLEGIQTRIVKKYLPLLNLHVKEILDILSDGAMIIELFINSKSKVDMAIKGGTAASFSLLSGGEKMLCRLAVDIGLALLSFSRCAKKPEIICLDEIFGPLDDSHTGAVFRLLERLRTKFNRVLVISHKSEINEMIDRQILVEKEHGDFGRSKIKAIV